MLLSTKRIGIYTLMTLILSRLIFSLNLRSRNMNKQEFYYTPTIIHHHDEHDDYDNHVFTHHQDILFTHDFQDCPCARSFRCLPCAERVHTIFEPCACAKINCPICPPLSLIHEIAARKVFQ